MKKIIFFIFIICLTLLVFTDTVWALGYMSTQHHYSFDLPEGWVKIPKSKIDDVIKQITDQTNTKYIDIATGFQSSSGSDIRYPYVLVKDYKTSPPSYNQITEVLGSDKLSQKWEEKTDDYSKITSEVNLQKPFIDKERNIIFITGEMDVPNVGRVKTLSAIFLGREGMVQLSFSSLKSEYSENLSEFNQIIDSFKYEKGYGYNAKEAENVNPSIFEGVLSKATTSAVASVLIVLIIIGSAVFFRADARRRNREKKDKEKTISQKRTKKEALDYYLLALKKYAVFSGRSQRAEYWYFFLFNFIISFGLAIIDIFIGAFSFKINIGALSGFYALAVLIPYIAVGVRRLHDTNRSGWWLLLGLLFFVPIINLVTGIVLLYFLIQDSQTGENRYGSNPKKENKSTIDHKQTSKENTLINEVEKSKGINFPKRSKKKKDSEKDFQNFINVIIVITLLVFVGIALLTNYYKNEEKVLESKREFPEVLKSKREFPNLPNLGVCRICNEELPKTVGEKPVTIFGLDWSIFKTKTIGNTLNPIGSNIRTYRTRGKFIEVAIKVDNNTSKPIWLTEQRPVFRIQDDESRVYEEIRVGIGRHQGCSEFYSIQPRLDEIARNEVKPGIPYIFSAFFEVASDSENYKLIIDKPEKLQTRSYEYH